jgi:methionyl-tRNA formyltransferase
MKLVFCGTPNFAVSTLEALIAAEHEVVLVLSQPDKPVGRNGEVHPTPVKQAAMEHGITVTQPEKLKHNDALQATLKSMVRCCRVGVVLRRSSGRLLLVIRRPV